jgi:hypothetical protein
MRWGRKTLHGYWRNPTVALPAIVREEPAAQVATAERETLAPELERVTYLALHKLEQILRIPTDRGDGNLLRAQTAAAGLAVNAQLRADEAKLKQTRRGDIMERIIAMLAEEKAAPAEPDGRWQFEPRPPGGLSACTALRLGAAAGSEIAVERRLLGIYTNAQWW